MVAEKHSAKFFLRVLCLCSFFIKRNSFFIIAFVCVFWSIERTEIIVFVQFLLCVQYNIFISLFALFLPFASSLFICAKLETHLPPHTANRDEA